MVRLSVAIITRNEKEKIRDCLESVRFADEIVVVDSGSSDGTPDICREYTDNVFHRNWTGFPDQREYACSKAGGPWVLVLDADERVSASLREEIKTLLAGGDGGGEGPTHYLIPRREHLLGGWVAAGDWTRYHLRLFRKDLCGCIYTRDVHERVLVRGAGGRFSGAILHLSHPTSAAFLARINSYTDLEAAYASRQGKHFSWARALGLPVAVLFYRFCWRGGYRDGVRGFALAALQGFYHFAKEIKLWEMTAVAAAPQEGKKGNGG